MIRIAKLWPAQLLAALFVLAACATAPAAQPAPVTQIVSGTSFGMCVGYCTTRLEVREGEAVLIREARGGRGAPGNLPAQRFTAALTPAEWRDLAALAANADIARLPPVIGCPDCADGGAETLAIMRDGDARAITFDHGARIAEAQALLDRLRALRERLTPKE